jgi:hypothetical protein
MLVLMSAISGVYTKMSKTGIDNFKYWVEDDKRNKKMGISLNYKDFFDVTDKQYNSIWGDHFNGSIHLEVDYSANELVTLIFAWPKFFGENKCQYRKFSGNINHCR